MTLTTSINFERHIPYYIQLRDLLKEQIYQKKWQPGDQIPGEQELCELYGVSRTVVRQALSELEAEGAIKRRRAKAPSSLSLKSARA
jgi:GntR family transcriptional regulator